MQKPDPSKSRINDIFTARFENMQPVDELEQLKHHGDPLFTELDPVYKSSWLLDRMLVKICSENHITEAYFAEKYKLYALKVLGMHPTQASNNRSNLLKALKAGNITFKRFLEVVCKVLAFNIEQVVFEVVEPSGTKQAFSLKEQKEIQDDMNTIIDVFDKVNKKD